ncbi:MAG: hypothetical protein HKP61_03270 [Dactylosporangium sp.]|nr:hypothetical protein [Dactylosporangium sp.]NNJ59974.1 hypothetical protein [Dactylosporangium sp.]
MLAASNLEQSRSTCRDYAEEHPNSLLHAYITWDDDLILKVSDRNLTVGLEQQGQQVQSNLYLGKKLGDAVNDADSRFRFACYPHPAGLSRRCSGRTDAAVMTWRR